MKTNGRPTIYSDELADEICSRIAGGESLNSICKEDDKPHISTVLLWVVNGKHEGFFDKYRIAREAQGLWDGDKIRDVVFDMLTEDGVEPQVAKVAIDAFKWTAERNMSRVYGPKARDAQRETVEVESDGFDEQMKKATEGAFK